MRGNQGVVDRLTANNPRVDLFSMRSRANSRKFLRIPTVKPGLKDYKRPIRIAFRKGTLDR